jgi:uncharacterized protein YjbI with pentapeptide repeats
MGQVKIVTIVVIIALVILLLYIVTLAAMSNVWPAWIGLNDKTAWDAAELLGIPLALLVAAYVFIKNQSAQALELARQQSEQARQIAGEERRQERELAQDRNQETALQNYLDRMTELLFNGLRRSDQDSEICMLARAHTLAVLRDLNEGRRASVVQFLYESDLINAPQPTIGLFGAHLDGVNLGWTNLEEINLERANLYRANLEGARLCGANLAWARLFGANLNGANLEEASLAGANLEEANLHKANLGRANLKGVIYNQQTIWPDGFKPTQAGAIDADGEPQQVRPQLEEV